MAWVRRETVPHHPLHRQYFLRYVFRVRETCRCVHDNSQFSFYRLSMHKKKMHLALTFFSFTPSQERLRTGTQTIKQRYGGNRKTITKKKIINNLLWEAISRKYIPQRKSHVIIKLLWHHSLSYSVLFRHCSGAPSCVLKVIACHKLTEAPCLELIPGVCGPISAPVNGFAGKERYLMKCNTFNLHQS